MDNTKLTIEDYEELLGNLEYLGATCNKMEKEMRYMNDFIRWMHLEKMYTDFRKNAVKVDPEDGFPYYTIKPDESISKVFCS